MGNGRAYLEQQAAKRPQLIAPTDLRAEVVALWKAGLPPGDKTGWPSVDKHYTVVPGQVTVVTGWPGSGKSEWLDALLVNLARQGWKIAMFSPENRPVELHLTKLLEKATGKPFGAGPSERISEDEIPEDLDELAQSFRFIDTPSEDPISPKEVIEAAVPWLDQFKSGKRGLVLDPWNELEHWRPGHLSETEYVSQTLSMVRGWARKNKVHVWIVAHPQKMRKQDGELPIPRPDMISGSQHWWNKADCAVTVYRDFDPDKPPEVQIHVQKVRFKHVGSIGAATLRYDRVTGRYHEVPSLKAVADYRRMARGDDD